MRLYGDIIAAIVEEITEFCKICAIKVSLELVDVYKLRLVEGSLIHCIKFLCF